MEEIIKGKPRLTKATNFYKSYFDNFDKSDAGINTY